MIFTESPVRSEAWQPPPQPLPAKRFHGHGRVIGARSWSKGSKGQRLIGMTRYGRASREAFSLTERCDPSSRREHAAL